MCGKREERDERDGPLVCGVAVLEYCETRGLGVMARGLLSGVTCDMFLSIFRRDREREKNKINVEERKIFGLACRG